MKRLTQSLNLKIGAVVLLVEIVCLAIIGFYFTSRFQAQVDENILTNVRKPGMLIMRGLLGYDIVTDRQMLQDLVGQEPVDGMVVGVGGNRIYFSMNPAYQGKSVDDVPGLQPAWFVSDVNRNLVLPIQENGQDYLVSIIPIFYEEARPMLFAYFKVNTSRAEQEKGAIAWTFALGILFTVLTSWLAIFLVYRRLVAERLAQTLATVQRLEGGDLSARIHGSVGGDQINILQQGINAMAAELERSAAASQQQLDEIQEARAAVQEGQTRLELALEGAGLGLWDWDIETGHVVYNQNLADMLGYPLEEIPPHIGGWEEMIHPEDMPQVMHAFVEHFAGRSPHYENEVRMRTRAGEWKWILARGKLVERDSDGTPRRATGTYLDINDRRLAEGALRESQARYRSLFENAPVSLQEVDFSGALAVLNDLRRKGFNLRAYMSSHREVLQACVHAFRVLDANQATLELYGAKTVAEFMENLPLVLSDKIPEKFIDALAGLTEGQLEYTVEDINRTLSGERLDIQMKWLVAPGYEQTLEKVFVAVTDVTERRRSEQAVVESRARYHSLFENSPISLWEQDFSGVKAILDDLRREGVGDVEAYLNAHPGVVRQCLGAVRLMDANRATLELYAAQSRDELYDNLGEMFIGSIPEHYVEELQAIARGESYFECERSNRKKNGEEILIQLRWVVAPGSEHSYAQVFVSIIDVTQSRRAEEALQESQARYLSLFESAPVSLWDEDYSEVKRLLDELKAQGVGDLRTYFEQNPAEAERCNSAFRVIDINQATLKLYGANSKEELLRNLPLILGTRSHQSMVADLLAIGESRREIELEEINHTLDGETIDVFVRSIVVPGYEDTQAKVIVSVTDMTQRKRSEEALRESQSRYRSLFENSPIPLWVEDFSQARQMLKDLRNQGVEDMRAYLSHNLEVVMDCVRSVRVLSANRAALELYGAPSLEALVDNLESRLGDQAAGHFIDELATIANGGPVFETETVNYRLDGEPINIQARWVVAPGSEETYEQVIFSVLDMTARKRAEQAVSESQARYRSLFENSPVALWEEDLSGLKQVIGRLRREGAGDIRAYLHLHPEVVRECKDLVQIIDLNQAAAQMYGLESKEQFLANRSIARQSFVDESFIEELVAIAEGRLEYRGEKTVNDLQGRGIFQQIRWMVAPGYESTYGRVFLSVVDLSELKRAEQAVSESQARYRSLFENSPVALWEENLSGIKQVIERLRREGAGDIGTYLHLHPEVVRECEALVQIIDINQAAAQMYGLESKETFLADQSIARQSFVDESFIEELVAIAEGRLEYRGEKVVGDLQGRGIFQQIRWMVAPGYESTYGRVFLSIVDLSELKRAEQAVSESQARYRSLFENSPVALWEEDMSGIKQVIERLRREGVVDMRGYLETHPEVVKECKALVHALDLNQAAVQMYGSQTKQQVLGETPDVLDSIIQDKFIDEMMCIAEGRPAYAGEKVSYDAQGNQFTHQIKWSVAPGCEASYAKIITSVVDFTELKRAESALRQSQQRLELAVQGGDLGLWDWDVPNRTSVYNRKWAEMLGYTLEETEPTDQFWRRLLHPEDRPWALERLNAHLEGRTPFYEAEFRMRTRQGGWCWVQTRGMVVERDAAGQPLRVAGTHLDVTERKRADEALRQSQQRLELALQGGDLGLWDWSLTSDTSSKNQRYADMLGYSMEVINQAGFWESLLHPEDAAEVQRRQQAHLEGRTPFYEAEFRLRTASGDWKWILARGKVVERDAAGKPLRMTGTHLDITERKLAEQALAESREQLRLIYHILPVGILVTDAGNRIIDANPAAAQLLGNTVEQLLQHSLTEASSRIHLDGEKMAEEESPVLRAVCQQVVVSGELLGLQLPGGLRWFTVSAAPLPLPDGGAVIAFEDISGRIEDERRIKADQQRFETLYELYRISNRPENEIIDFALDAAVGITQSRMGYIAFTNEDETVLNLYAWSKKVMDECDVVDKTFTYEVTETGLWGEAIRQRKAIITNDYAAPNPLKRGTPAGHVPLQRHMNVPTFDGEHIVSVCGVGNKAEPYDESDVLHLQLLMDGLWGILRRKRAEETLRESRQRLELALRGGDLGLWDRDLVSGRTVRNPRYAEMLGYTLDEISPTAAFWEENIHPEDVEAVQQGMKDHAAGRSPAYEVEYRMQTKTGEWKWILGRGMVVARDAKGNALRMVGTNMDIDQRKRAEEALRARVLALTEPVGGVAALKFSDVFDLEEVQNLQDAFAEATGTASIITDVEGNPITRPSNFCTLCSEVIRGMDIGLRNCMESAVVMGKPNLSGPTLHPCLSGGLWDAGASITLGDQHLANWLIGQVLTEDFDEEKLAAYARQIGADEGQFRQALQSVPRMPLAQFQNVAQALFIIARQISRLALQNLLQARDIERRARSEAALRDSERKILELNEDLERRVIERTADLQEVNRELESFSYSVSHDLRAPLRAIDGFSRILEEDHGPQLDDEARQYLNLVRQNSRRMAQLIDDLLTFSRMGRQMLNKRPVDLGALAGQVFSELRQVEPEERQVEFILKAMPTWQADASLMRQVFANLLANALKFTSQRSHAVIEVGSLLENGREVCYVSDNGAGFDMTYVDKLFGVFQRLHRAEEFSGTGVGLAIVQRIINRHGGKIWAKAAVDEGATFFFTLGERD